MILDELGKSHELIEFIADRLGHDFRYSVDCSKLEKLGWKTTIDFKRGLQETIQWYREHESWLVKKRSFLEAYWKKTYKRN